MTDALGRPRAAGEESPGPYAWARTLGPLATGSAVGDPVAVAIAPAGDVVYVASRGPASVTRWAPDGRALGALGAEGAAAPDPPAGADLPEALAFDPAAGAPAWPAGIACDAAGAVYVSDEGRRWVRHLAPNGELLATWGVWGWQGLVGAVHGAFGRAVPGRFARPAGIAVGPDGRVYVVEACHRRVEQYAPSGELLGAWGGAGTGFGVPWGIAVDPARGLVYVADWSRDRVQCFDLDGRPAGTLGRSGAAAGALRRPAGLAIDPDGRLAVADWGNDRVQVWAPDGAPSRTPEAVLRGHAHPAADAGPASTDGALRGPRGVAFDGAGTLYVADTLGQRVQVYRRR